MLRTFFITFMIKNTSRTNSIIYSIKRLPLIGKHITANLYKEGALKIIAGILSVLSGFLMAFVGKAIYMGLLFAFAAGFPVSVSDNAIFIHLFVFMTFTGVILNPYIFSADNNTCHCINLLDMDARKYAVSQFIFSLLKLVIGLLPFAIIFGRLLNVPLAVCVTMPLFVASAKITYVYTLIILYKKCKRIPYSSQKRSCRPIFGIIFFVAAYALPFINVTVNVSVYVILLVVLVAASVPGLVIIIKFDGYRTCYKVLIQEFRNIFDLSAKESFIAASSRKYISDDITQTSDKTGFKYLNELFMKRHKRLLIKPILITTLICAAIFFIIICACFIYTPIKPNVNRTVIRVIPVFTFIMYIINKGTSYTQALFANCDHSLLTYSFYKTPSSILKLFKIRLWEIIKINILPAVVISFGMIMLLIVTGGTHMQYYFLIPVSIIMMSIFFSVHFLTIYYLLQPYNIDTEIKSGTFQVVNFITYMFCYMFIQIHPNPFWFAIIMTAFCALYSVIACMLVYKFAARTFRIRN